MLSLPAEILTDIIAQTSPVDVMNLSFTCKALLEVIEGDECAFLRRFIALSCTRTDITGTATLSSCSVPNVKEAFADLLSSTTCLFCRRNPLSFPKLADSDKYMCRSCYATSRKGWKKKMYSRKGDVLENALAKQCIFLPRLSRIKKQFSFGHLEFRQAIRQA